MTTLQTLPESQQKHIPFIQRYVRFDKPSNMPSLLVSWHESLDDGVSRALRKGLKVELTSKPVDGMEIIGAKTRLLIRDNALAKNKRQQEDVLFGYILLFDQFCVLEMNDQADANAFIETLLVMITQNCVNLKVSVTETTELTRRMLLENGNGYKLYCVTAINRLFDLNNDDAVDLFIHWKLEYDQSARKSNYTAQDSNLFDSAEVVR